MKGWGYRPSIKRKKKSYLFAHHIRYVNWFFVSAGKNVRRKYVTLRFRINGLFHSSKTFWVITFNQHNELIYMISLSLLYLVEPFYTIRGNWKRSPKWESRIELNFIQPFPRYSTHEGPRNCLMKRTSELLIFREELTGSKQIWMT